MSAQIRWRWRRLFAAIAFAATIAVVLTAAPSAVAIQCDSELDPCEPDTSESSAPDAGLLDVMRVPGGLYARGYAIDPDTDLPVSVTFSADGWPIGTAAADTFYASNTLRLVYPTHTDFHGFEATVPVSAPSSQICAEPHDLESDGLPGTLLGTSSCTVFQVSVNPFGGLESSNVPGMRRVFGFAIDPDTAAPIDVKVKRLVIGATAYTEYGTFRAELERQDVGAANPGYGNLHGFDIPLPDDTADACVEAVNVASGANVNLGCRFVGDPIKTGGVGVDLAPKQSPPPVCSGTERATLRLVDERNLLDYEVRVHSAPWLPSDARVTTVRNITDGNNDRVGNEIPTPDIDVRHEGRQATLGHDGATNAFNGTLVPGEWTAHARSTIGLNGWKGEDQTSWGVKPSFTLAISWTRCA
jgi:hypothetical protein